MRGAGGERYKGVASYKNRLLNMEEGQSTEQSLQDEGEEEEEDDYDVTEKVDEFFTELDIEQEQRRRRLRSEGIRVILFNFNII